MQINNQFLASNNQDSRSCYAPTKWGRINKIEIKPNLICSSRYFFSQTDFLPREFLLVKKLEIDKTKTTFIISVLKVEYQPGVLIFFKFQLFLLIKVLREWKSVREKSTFFCKFSFMSETNKLNLIVRQEGLLAWMNTLLISEAPNILSYKKQMVSKRLGVR